jgi:putative transposase
MTVIVAVDMFVVATATFGMLYAVIVLDHHRRRVIHFEVTRKPTQVWLAQQITEAFPWHTAPRYLLRDRDTSFRAMGIQEVLTAPRCPWQSPYVERIIGSIRRECPPTTVRSGRAAAIARTNWGPIRRSSMVTGGDGSRG